MNITFIRAVFLFAASSQVAYSQPCNTEILGNISQEGNVINSTEYNNGLLYASVLGSFNGLNIFDASDPTSSELVGQYETDESALWVTVADSTAYLLTTNGLICIDTTDPTLPTVIGSYDTQFLAPQATLSNNLLYIADLRYGLFIFDVSAHSSPVLLGNHFSEEALHSVVTDGNTAYVTSNRGTLYVLDTTDPASLSILGSYTDPIPTNYHGLNVVDPLAYVARATTMSIFDVSDPTSITFLSEFDTGSFTESVNIVGSTVFIGGFFDVVPSDGPGFHVVDVADPSSPAEVTSEFVPGFGVSIHIANNTAYVASGRDDGIYMIGIDGCIATDCIADVNGDGMLTPTDFTAWINAFNNTLPGCDQNQDGLCTPTDFTAWIANYNAGCP